MLRVSRLLQANFSPFSMVSGLMSLLPPGTPAPEIKVVNTPSSSWLGRCKYTYGDLTTQIELQKVITVDETTLKRILAHELCHHAEFLEGKQKADASGWSIPIWKRMDRLTRISHGAAFKKWADKFNSVYGADFVTETSDTAMTVGETSSDVQVLLWKISNGTIRWCYAQRPSTRQKEFIQKYSEDPAYKLVKSRDVDFTQGVSVGRGWSSTWDAGLNKKLTNLWDAN